MIKHAHDYSAQVQSALADIPLRIDAYKYKYYFDSHWHWDLIGAKTLWDRVELVSVDKENKLCGLFAAVLQRPENYVSALSIINFAEKPTFTFSNDLKRFIEILDNNIGCYKMCWSVNIGNPAEKMYDRLCEKLGGRIVGVFKQHTQLIDGTIVDEKRYEVFF